MNFEMFVKMVKNKLGIDLDREKFSANCVLAARQLKDQEAVSAKEEGITTEVIQGLEKSLKLGFLPHSITKPKLKVAQGVLKSMSELMAEDKEASDFYKALHELVKQMLEDTSGKKPR